MSKRFDVMAPRPGREEGKTFWHRVGTAFEGEKGIGIVFDSLPIPDKEGRVSVRLFEPREKSNSESKPAQRISNRAAIKEDPRITTGRRADLDDEIPF